MLFSVYHYRACTHIPLHAEVDLVVSLHSLSRSQSLNLTKGLATSLARTHTLDTIRRCSAPKHQRCWTKSGLAA